MNDNTDSTKIEIIFDGTPDQFLEMVSIFSTARLGLREPYRWDVFYEFNTIELNDLQNQKETCVYIKAQSLPNNRALLFLYYKNDEWEELQQWWDLLKTEMIRQGWISKDIEQRKWKSGRPRDPINEWAYKEVNVHNKKPEEVFKKWLEKIGAKADTLVDPKDSFYHAIKKRKNK